MTTILSPPNLKKSPLMPISFYLKPNTSDHISDNCSSSSFRGATYVSVFKELKSGNALLSSFPLIVRGNDSN